MKKTILLFAFALLVYAVQAQEYTCETLWHHFGVDPDGSTSILKKCLTMVEKPDGNILADLHFVKLGKNRNGFFTVTTQEAAVVDSSFLEGNPLFEEDNASNCLLAHNPSGEGYIYAKFCSNKISCPNWSGFTGLEIMLLDENLSFPGYDEAVFVKLEDGVAESSRSILMEGDKYLVVRYVMDGVPVLARVSLDGVVMDKSPMPDLFHGERWKINNVVTYNETPREYALYGWDTSEVGDTVFLFHVVDSLFSLRETVVMENQSGHYHYFNNMMTLLSYDEETYYVTSQYTKDNETRIGLRVAKYDKTSHEELCEMLIQSQPMYLNLDYCAIPIALEKSNDGNLYLGYRTCNLPEHGSISVMKLDSDLNVIWGRQCQVVSSYEDFKSPRMRVLENGLVLCAVHTWTTFYSGNHKSNMVFFIFDDNGIIAVPEMEKYIRPYAFYPNPVNDRLNIQYSPDVQPTQIELYDLQGRLVRTQNKGLESLNMEGLPAGIYTMRVMLEGGKVFSDKVVKE